MSVKLIYMFIELICLYLFHLMLCSNIKVVWTFFFRWTVSEVVFVPFLLNSLVSVLQLDDSKSTHTKKISQWFVGCSSWFHEVHMYFVWVKVMIFCVLSILTWQAIQSSDPGIIIVITYPEFDLVLNWNYWSTLPKWEEGTFVKNYQAGIAKSKMNVSWNSFQMVGQCLPQLFWVLYFNCATQSSEI